MAVDVRCKQQIAVAQPCTGSNAYTLGSYFIINIPRCRPDYLFNPINSFLRFNASNADGTGVLNFDDSVNSLISKLEVLHAGNVLEVIDNSPQLSVFLIDTQVHQASRITGLNLTGVKIKYYGFFHLETFLPFLVNLEGSKVKKWAGKGEG